MPRMCASLRPGRTSNDLDLPYAFRAGETSFFYSTLEELAGELAKRKVNRLWGLPRPHGLLEQAEGLSAEEATRLVRLACAKKNASDDIVAMPSDSHSAAHGVEHA
jgi:hypothetical protein